MSQQFLIIWVKGGRVLMCRGGEIHLHFHAPLQYRFDVCDITVYNIFFLYFLVFLSYLFAGSGLVQGLLFWPRLNESCKFSSSYIFVTSVQLTVFTSLHFLINSHKMSRPFRSAWCLLEEHPFTLVPRLGRRPGTFGFL